MSCELQSLVDGFDCVAATCSNCRFRNKVSEYVAGLRTASAASLRRSCRWRQQQQEYVSITSKQFISLLAFLSAVCLTQALLIILFLAVPDVRASLKSPCILLSAPAGPARSPQHSFAPGTVAGTDCRASNGSKILVFAFYFPQFHPIPENDAVFGKGFTEWTLIRASPDTNRYGKPVRKPTTLGYYDLRDVKVRQQQGELAKQYGVDGFFIYHYWLENHIVMGDVVDNMLRDGQPNRPWALCWANESWKGKFYGVDRGATYLQRYDEPLKHAEYLVKTFHSPSYLFINGRPVLSVYILAAVPPKYLQILRSAVYRMTGWNLYLIKAASNMDLGEPFKSSGHVDAMIEFYVNLPLIPSPDCQQEFGAAHSHSPTLHSHKVTDIPVWRGSLTGWDPTPRYPNTSAAAQKGGVENCDLSAQAFGGALQERMRKALCEAGGRQILFSLFAWNEWGEGAVLEPNTVDGLGLLEAVSSAKQAAERLYVEDHASGRCEESSQIYIGDHCFAVDGGHLPL